MKRTLLLPLLVALLLLCVSLVSCGHEHSFVGWENVKAPTCTEEGSRVGTCECGETSTAAVPARGHGETRQRIAKDATCTAVGTLETICTVCEQVTEQTEIAKRPHTPSTEIVKAPTCKTSGSERTTCTVCEEVLNTRFLPMEQHKDLSYEYNGDATALADGTATAACPHCDYEQTKTLIGTAEMIAKAFGHLNISVIGDSISTYPGVTNGGAADITNSTIRNNAVWNYGPSHPEYGVTSPSHTWWKRTADALGATLLVNNSWSGDKITSRALTRCLQLHDDTGSNAGTKPDIIFVYLGTNDFSAVAADVGSIAHLTMDDIAAKASQTNYTPASVAEGYAVMLYRMQQAYPGAEIYCLTVLEKPDVNVTALTTFNDGIEAVLSRFDGVYLADIFRDSGIHDGETFDYYVPSNRLHPGYEGMRVISEVLLKSIMQHSKYLDLDVESLLK